MSDVQCHFSFKNETVEWTPKTEVSEVKTQKAEEGFPPKSSSQKKPQLVPDEQMEAEKQEIKGQYEFPPNSNDFLILYEKSKRKNR